MRSVSVLLGVVFGCLLAVLIAIPAAAQAPANDEPSGAIPITELPYSNVQDTSEATLTQYGGCTSGDVGSNVWYAFTPAEDGRVLVDTRASDYDTGLNVFAGDPGDGTFLGCQEKYIQFDAAVGTTYYIEVASCCGSTAGGTLVIDVSAAAEPPTVQITVDPVGRVDARSGIATLSGTASCSPTVDNAVLEVFLSQRVGRFTFSGQNGINIGCAEDGSPVPWQVSVQPNNGKFAGGFADASVQAVGCNNLECAFDQSDLRVKLRR